MNRKMFTSLLLILFIGFGGPLLGRFLVDFDFENRIGISIMNLLIIFLVITYVPLIYIYFKKKRANAS